MRKIISILVALGVVLSFSVMATPVSANVTTPGVVVYPDCACVNATYNITFNTTASLTEGVHCVCIKFPAGTTVPATGSAWVNGDIKINGHSVFGAEVTVTGTEVCFLAPVSEVPGPTWVFFELAAGIGNPCTPGKYNLEVRTCREPDKTYVKSADYTIVPAVSIYDFVWDSNPTYPGIAVGFVPPFKACGQNSEDGATGDIPHPFIPGGNLNAFNLTLEPKTVGCVTPCTGNVTISFALTAAPAGSKVSLAFDGTTITHNLTLTAPTGVVGNVTLGTNTTIEWANYIHFDTVGNYTICFYADCQVPPPTCTAQPSTSRIAEECFPFKVYQWKSAMKITLQEKWNLISLPLVPLVDPPVATTLASIPAADLANIISIWNYDRCTNKWAVYPTPSAGQDTLTQLVDGDAYWVRVKYSLPNCGNISWWVWGTPKPMPPSAPADYEVCEGWNMVGFLGTAFNVTPAAYLWNWDLPTPVVYGWDQGCWNVQNWNLINGAETLTPGQGYWVAFPADGDIFVP